MLMPWVVTSTKANHSRELCNSTIVFALFSLLIFSSLCYISKSIEPLRRSSNLKARKNNVMQDRKKKEKK